MTVPRSEAPNRSASGYLGKSTIGAESASGTLGQTGSMADLEQDDLAWLEDHGYDHVAVADATAWFADRGWKIEVVQRDRREEMRARGEVYFPGYRHQLWVDLVRVGQEEATASNYASGHTRAEAIIRARQRFGSEQE